MLTNRKVIFPADLSQGYYRIRKCNLFQAHYRIPYRKYLTALISILIDNIDYFNHHIFFPPLTQQVLFWDILVNVLITPNLQFSSLADVKHVFKDLKMPVILVEYLEALQCNCQAMQRILKRNLIDL